MFDTTAMRPIKPFKNTYLANWNDDEILFRRPLYVRIVAVLCTVFLAVLLISLVWMIVTDKSAPKRHDPATYVNVMLLLVSIVLIAGPVYSLYGAGPCSLLVNLRRWTYRLKQGFPLLATETTGPLEDIAGLYFKNIKQGFCIFVK